MRCLDDFLVDRLFQPVVDRLSPLVSPYALAAFLETGACLAILAIAVWQRSWLVVLVVMSWIPIVLFRAYHQERAPPSNALPSKRLHGIFLRVGLLLVQLALTPLYLLVETGAAGHVNLAAYWLVVIGEYLLACRYRPPTQRTKRGARAPSPLTT